MRESLLKIYKALVPHFLLLLPVVQHPLLMLPADLPTLSLKEWVRTLVISKILEHIKKQEILPWLLQPDLKSYMLEYINIIGSNLLHIATCASLRLRQSWYVMGFRTRKNIYIIFDSLAGLPYHCTCYVQGPGSTNTWYAIGGRTQHCIQCGS